MKAYLITYLEDRFPRNVLTDEDPVEWLLGMIETYGGEGWDDDAQFSRKRQVVISHVLETEMSQQDYNSAKEVINNA